MGKNEPGALKQIREQAELLAAQGKVDEMRELCLSALAAVLGKMQSLELLVAKLRREQAGKKSEKIDPRQLLLLFDELMNQETTEADVDPTVESAEDARLDAEIEKAEKEQQAANPKERKKRKGKAGWTTDGVEKKTKRVTLPEAERQCEACGGQMKPLGCDVTRRLEYIPGRFVEHEAHCEKWACGSCKGGGVTTAPAPPQVLERSAAGASLLAHVVVSKFADHTPLHRLHRIYSRTGANIPVSTLSDWVAGVGDLVAPLVERLAERVRSAFILRTDATGLRVLKPEAAEHIVRGSLWGYVGDDRDVLFLYTPTGEGATGPWKFLAGRKGYIQADAANVFDRLFNGLVATATEIGCWSHARRRLEALRDTDCRVALPLRFIARLYRIEHLGDVRGLTTTERTQLRQERSVPVLDKLKRWYVTTATTEPPSTNLASAAAYGVNHWQALTRFVEDGRIDPDNNLCERQMRDIALGRKNYLFAGSEEAAHRAARLYSLTRTCAQYGVAPLEYFIDVLAKLGAGWDNDRLDELLPHRWRPPTAEESNARSP